MQSPNTIIPLFTAGGQQGHADLPAQEVRKQPQVWQGVRARSLLLLRAQGCSHQRGGDGEHQEAPHVDGYR